jgi:protein-disulfide isomerase
MTALRRIGFAVALLLLTSCNQEAATAPKSKQAAAKAVSGRDWSKTVSATADGGFVMGNPAAKVKLIEYGSLTCPHCAAFSREGAPLIIEQYVKPGLVSYEFRSFARDPIDLAVSTLAHCSSPATYFPLIDQLYADQDQWLEKVIKASDDEKKRIDAMQPQEAMDATIKLAGLDRFMAQRGFPASHTRQCVTDKKNMDRIVTIRGTAVSKFGVDGTPTFIINGVKADQVYDYTTLAPRLQDAVGS